MPNETSNLDTLIRKRASIKAKLTIFQKFYTAFNEKLIDNPMSELALTELQCRTERISKVIDEFDKVQCDIESLVESIDEQIVEREHFETSFFGVISSAKKLIASSSNNVVINTRNQNISDIQGSSSDISSTLASANGVKLPTIQLPKFEGQYDSWLEYRDTFESLIHTNSSIHSIQKFHYLRASLGGGAAQVIKSLEFSASNYEVAWDILCDRYNNTKLLINNHVKALFNIEPISKESAYKLRQIIDTVTKHLRALETLKEPVEKWDTLIVYLVTTKLDAITVREWEQRKGKDNQTFDELKQFLKSRADLLETLESNNNSHKMNPRMKDSNQSKLKSFVATNITCENCTGNHYIQNCPDFLKLDIDKRIEKILSLKLCLNCLRRGHFNKTCKLRTCKECSKKHNTLLHLNKVQTNESNTNVPKPETDSVALSSLNLSQISPVILSTAVIKILNKDKLEQNVRVLLDAGSQSSFITTNLCESLKLPKTNINITIGGFNHKTTNVNQRCEAEILSRNNQFRTKITCLVVPEITGELPNFTMNKLNLQIPGNIQLADPNFDKPAKIDMLLGADCFWDFICVGQIKLFKNGPTLQKTRFGWVLAGPTNTASQNYIQCNFSKTMSSVDDKLVRFWEVENCPNTKILSNEEKLCEEHFMANTIREKDGHFVVTIPFKDSVTKLGDSKSKALKRFFSLEKRLQNDKILWDEYTKFMNEYEILGHMRKVNDDNINLNSKCYFLAHHAVVKEDSLTTKVRVVFDGSAATSTGCSLNSLQMVGPTIQDDLFSILLRFRKHNYVFCADIEKMYRQVKINPEQYSLQQILWRTDPLKPIDTYQLQTVTYGLAAAPFLAIRSLVQLGIDSESKHPQAAHLIKHDFYVDDLISGANSITSSIDLCIQISQILEQGGFKLRKWISNDPKISLALSNISSNVVLNMGSNENAKTLGLYWNSNTDQLFYLIKENSEKRVTKRTILSDVCQIFDPLGLLSPVIIIGKILLQGLWLEKLSWDESLPLSLQTKWNSFRNELIYLNDIKVNRQAFSKNYVSIQLHGFSDSSIEAYGACVLVRCKDDNGNVFVNLLTAKSKVAPIKTISIPRLELCAALVLAQLMNKVQSALNISLESITYWTDSTIVLCWLNITPNKLQTFVGNRVARIQEMTDIKCWRHTPTFDNPADCLTRGVSPKKLRDLQIWWQGPSWLKEDECCWPNLNPSNTDIPEMRKTVQSLVVTMTDYLPFDRFSCFHKMKRIFCYCLRFKHNCLNPENKITGHITMEELNKIEICLIKAVQNECLKDDVNYLYKNQSERINKSILGLTPFLDDNNIIRVGGRLNNSLFSYDKKHPILLPATHKFTKLLFLSEHKRLLHAGPQQLLSSIREQYWPLGGRNLARKIVHGCIKCFRAKPKVITPIMGELPAQRLTPSPPFYCTGVDYAGPILIKDKQGRGCKSIKAYIALFICFSTKALHLELVSSLTTDCYIAALNRFIARRGKPFEMFSDNGKNFVGANSEFQKFLSENNSKIKQDSVNKGIQWHFIPPYSPHFGGLWESGVRSTKHHIKRVAGTALMTFEQLYTLLVEIEAILNSRPMFPASSDPNDLEPITPAHFLIGRTLTSVPGPNLTSIPENRLSALQRVQQIKQNFWSRWSKEYVSLLQDRTKWKINCGTLVEGTLVLIKDDNLPPLSWKLGRIIQVFHGSDGIARVANIKTSSGIIKRAFSKICPLPMDDDVLASVSEVKSSA